MKYAPNGFRDTNNSNNTVNVNNSNLNSVHFNTNAELASALNRERKSKSNRKAKGRDEIEFPSIKAFQKELWQKIYSKESGEILQILRKSNENIRSSKIAVYENSPGCALDRRNCDKNVSESQRLENSDNDYMHFFNPNNNLNNLEKFSSSLKLQSFSNNEEKLLEDDLLNENNSKFYLKEKSESNKNNNNCDEGEKSISNFHPEMVAYKVKGKKKQRSDSNIFKSNDDNNNNNSTNNNNEKSSYDVSNEMGLGQLMNRSETLNAFTDKTKNPISNLLIKNISENNLNEINNNYKNNNNNNEINNSEFNQVEEKSLYLTQSSRNGFPKILKKISSNMDIKLANSLNSQNLSATLNNLNYNNNNNSSNNNIHNFSSNLFAGSGNQSERKLSNFSFLNNNVISNNHLTNSQKLNNQQQQSNIINHPSNLNLNFESSNYKSNVINNTANRFISNLSSNNVNNPNSVNNINNDNMNNFGTFINSSNNIQVNNSGSNHTLNSITKALYKKQGKFFCPHCEHCNVIKDENLEKYFNMKEAKSIVRKSLDFIVTNYQTDQSYLDFLLGNNNPGLNYLNYINADSLQQINTNNNLHLNNAEYENLKNLKNRTKFDIETLLNTYPKHSNNRTVLQLVTHFLDALINDKVSLDSIAGPEIFERLKESLISQGIAFKENEGEIEFDKELDIIFDEATKEKLRKLFKKKFMNMKKNNEDNGSKGEEQMVETRKRFMLLFLIFIQILSEVGSECKEKAVLLYRVFKLFFVEQEKKWTVITNHMKQKIHYYKELAKTVIQQKNKHLAKIETINDVLFANKLSLENLQNHKNLIKDLLNVVNEKRDQIYLLMSENEILTKELNFWVYDFEKLKLDNSIRERLKELNIPKMVQNVNDEMSHKQVPEAEKLLLVNADRYLIVSGHRNYFYDQKNYYLSEIARISELYDNCKFKKKSYKRSVNDMKAQMEREVGRLEKDIQYFRDKLSCEKKDILVQTDVDNFAYNKILKNHNLINYQRRMTYNKLTNLIEKIKFNCSKQKPISKKSVLNFIPEIYNEKLELDSRLDLEGKPKTTMDEFFLKFMKDKFKLTKIIKRNCEQMLMSILKYAAEDGRIDLLRKFLSIGDDKVKREILDCYLTVLKNLPISFYKLFEEGFPDFLMTLDNCMEILISKFPNFSIHIEGLDKLLRYSQISQAEKEVENLGLESRKDIFLLMKYYNKQNSAFQFLLNEFKNKTKNEESYLNIADQIMLANKEFDINFFQIAELLKRNFKIIDDKIQLESFLDYFVERFNFKLKITDFLQVCIDCFGVIYADLDKYLVKMWESADARRNGIIFYREFEAVLNVLLGNSENKWKISDYFKSACDSPDKDFLSREEFFSFCLNNKDILVILLAERNKNLPRK